VNPAPSPAPVLNVHRSATRDDEARHLIQLYDGDAGKIMTRLEGHLTILSARAQTLLSLAGITITVTGFSGASIARSGRPAAILLVSGLVLVLVAASMAMRGILAVRWTTSIPPCSLEEAIHAALDVRDAKTHAFSRSLGILILGLSLYVASVAYLLLMNLPA
jgi:hypothetical protein